jgi:hypothetical protein
MPRPQRTGICDAGAAAASPPPPCRRRRRSTPKRFDGGLMEHLHQHHRRLRLRLRRIGCCPCGRGDDPRVPPWCCVKIRTPSAPIIVCTGCELRANKWTSSPEPNEPLLLLLLLLLLSIAAVVVVVASDPPMCLRSVGRSVDRSIDRSIGIDGGLLLMAAAASGVVPALPALPALPFRREGGGG